MELGRRSSNSARSELFARPELVALPRVGIAVTMAVFLVVGDPQNADRPPFAILAALVVVLLAVSAVIQVVTNLWDSRRVAFMALGAAGIVAFDFLLDLEAGSFLLLALFWLVAEGALLLKFPVALGIWSAMSAGYVLSEVWSSPTWAGLEGEPTVALRVGATIVVMAVGGSLAAAAWALRAALRERAVSDQLRELDGMKNSFLQAVSHELRTPLASILGYALLLEQKEDRLSKEQREMALRQLATSSRKLNQLVIDLLDVDRLSRGIIEPQLSSTDVSELVLRVVEETPVGDRRVDLEVVPARAEVDASKVERIVENLLSNAAKYTPPGTPITVRVRPEDHGVYIVVEDAGPGVPDELKAAIFRAFARGTAAQRHSPGVGIGLSLVAQFAEMHGGRAWVEDRPGGGSSFKVFLPAGVQRTPEESLSA